MPDTTPADIAARSFRMRMRGFDPDEVHEFLQAVAHGLDELVVERDQLRSQLTDVGAKDLKAEFDSIGQEVAAVLQAAREAAESMRSRASSDAARWRSEAVAEAETERRQARSDAENLRGDAWSMAEELLKQSLAEATRLAAESEKEAMRAVGEAELESHRSLASARREGEEIVRAAKMEAERLLVSGQSRHDQLIEAAHRQTESAQERARALEARRTELARELESLRDALSNAELELDEKREALTLSPPQPEVTEPRAEWEGGETVRVVKPPPSAGSAEAPGPEPPRSVTAADAQPEIRLVSAAELKKRSGLPAVSIEPQPESAQNADDKHRDDVEQDPVDSNVDKLEDGVAEGEKRELVPEAPPTEAPETLVVDSEPIQAPDDESIPPTPTQPELGLDLVVTGLFARLREPPPATPVDSEAASVAESPDSAPAEPPTSKRTTRAASSAAADTSELRDQRLLPITNRSLRNLKRQLTDEANVVLDQIRSSEGEWSASVDSITERIRADLVVLVGESFGAGHAAVEELLGERVKRPGIPKDEPATGFATDLASELDEAVGEGHSADQGPQQLGSTVSRIFRTWRTDEAERRVRLLALTAYHRGVAETAKVAQRSVRIVAAGRGCATCRAAAEEIPATQLPPLHPGCECTLALQ